MAGFGINCKHCPPVAQFPATSLEQEGIEANPGHMFQLLARAFHESLGVWNHGVGFPATRARWLQYAGGLGETVQVKVPGKGVIAGVFHSLDDAGHMIIVQDNDEVVKVSVGDIFFSTEESSQTQ